MNDNPVCAMTEARPSPISWNASAQGLPGADGPLGRLVRKIAFAGKGDVGKTTLAALFGDWLARSGQDVTLIDADTALSLGAVCSLETAALPASLAEREDLVRERISDGVYLNLPPGRMICPRRFASPCRSDTARCTGRAQEKSSFWSWAGSAAAGICSGPCWPMS